jgi:hypothetical protein
MEKIADVDLKAGKAGDIACSKKDFARMAGRRVRSLILAQQDERLNRTAQGASGLNKITHLLKQRDRLGMEFSCGSILAQAPQGIPFRAQGVGLRFLVSKRVGNTDGSFSKFTSFVKIDSDLDAYSCIQLFNNRRGEQMVARKKSDSRGSAAKRGQAIKECLFFTFLRPH